MRKGLAHTNRMVVAALRRLVSATSRQPQLKRAARVLLARIPGLQPRLRAFLYRSMWTNQSGMAPPEPMIGNEAPVRTARIFRELKQAQQARKDRCE
ncbi:hypothetical protein ACSUZJ_04955 [Telluria sp. B2]